MEWIRKFLFHLVFKYFVPIDFCFPIWFYHLAFVYAIKWTYNFVHSLPGYEDNLSGEM